MVYLPNPWTNPMLGQCALRLATLSNTWYVNRSHNALSDAIEMIKGVTARAWPRIIESGRGREVQEQKTKMGIVAFSIGCLRKYCTAMRC